MPHFSVRYDIGGAIRGVTGTTADAQEARFFGNGGKIMMVESNGSSYVAGPTVNGIVQPGTNYIGTYTVDNLASASGLLSPIQAAKAIAIHEMGHAFYQQMVYMKQPGDNATMAAKVDWCMLREGSASFYGYQVAKESGFHYVAGTNKTPNLYETIESALKSYTPGSFAYETAGIAAAKSAFAADPQYAAYCSNPDNWSKPKYIPAAPPPTGGAPGSGSVINVAYQYVPEAGGYWLPIPNHPSNSESPGPEIDSLHIEVLGAIFRDDMVSDRASNDPYQMSAVDGAVALVGIQTDVYNMAVM